MSDTVIQLAAAARLPQAKPGWHLESAEQPAPRIAVLVPCCNEEATIAKVVSDFHGCLPQAVVYVYDNNSKDRTAFVARAAGAVVRTEPLQGKGHVVRRMFADVEADVFILVDGDDTYDADAAPAMLRLLLDQQLDMVNAARITAQNAAYRRGHRVGNAVLSAMVCGVFGGRISDVLSGYRAFSRRFVKSFPALAGGFETETEFTVHALELEMPVGEIGVSYRERPAGSTSKLRTWSDGLRILRTILMLVKEGRPLLFFAIIGSVLLLAALVSGGPVVMQFLHTGLVPKLPSALLATGLVLLSSLTLVCGLVLDSVERGRKEMKRLAYLAIPATPIRDV
ncbi:MAG TPA: glycosyltransferase [Acetobacteraceae bacterium]|jgi:glycosyltransferase involved in cell wall biosynthesis|nr:glycosyltransferase [Acetobacteraceae bacterium]